MTLLEAWNIYEQDKKLDGYSSATLKGYKIQHNLLIKHFGNIDIDTITLSDLKTYLIEKGNHLKQSSLGTRIRFIRAFFRWSSEEGYSETNPARKLKEPKLGKRLPKALNEEDTEMLLEGCNTLFEHALINFMYSTGIRIGEAYRLNRNALDWTNRSCVVLGKGDKEREVYFSVKAMIWLKKYLLNRKDTDTALFVTERNPIHRMGIAEIRYVVKRVAKNSEVEANVYPHRLRHSFATHLLNNGAPMEGIQTLMGHSKIETTNLYAQLSGSRRKEIYRKYF